MLKYLTFTKPAQIPADIDIIFVADMFTDDYVGGAELTSDALINSSPYKIFKLHSRDVSIETLSQGINKYWIFGNYAQLNFSLIPSIVANIRYSILEYDYKFCRYRSTEVHKMNEGKECDCHLTEYGNIVSSFMCGAKSLWFMAEKQLEKYKTYFPFLNKCLTNVLSSVFDQHTLATLRILNSSHQTVQRSGWIVLGSPSWIKGANDAEQWCRNNNLNYTVIWNEEYSSVLQKLAQAEGFVYLPKGDDTCPRMVIEAKLLGCKLHVNDYVQHFNEEWFATDDHELTFAYLQAAHSVFWNAITNDMGENNSTISGYTTTFNCISSDYPFIESITSMLGFCDQVVVVDAGSNDGTWEALETLASTEKKLLIHKQIRDKTKVRWAIDFDGRLKALARSLCTSAFCWQQDSDEIVHERDYDNIKRLIKFFPAETNLLCLPVIEYWGSKGKVRADIHNWKWRLSRNKPGITHGIPAELRRYDENGELYAAQGSDSCDYIWIGDYQRVASLNFYSNEIDILRRNAIVYQNDDLLQYEHWYNDIVTKLPTVHHYSWFNIERKAHMYKTHWSAFWASMYNADQKDIPENNMWFNKCWSEVTDDEISDIARKLENEKGGWIFHHRIDWSMPIPSITCKVSHPIIMKSWIDKNQRQLTTGIKND